MRPPQRALKHYSFELGIEFALAGTLFMLGKILKKWEVLGFLLWLSSLQEKGRS
jgi:hypothetical protein